MVSVRASDRPSANDSLDPTPPTRAQLAPVGNTAATVVPDVKTVPATRSVSYVSSHSLIERAWARLTGRAFSVFPPVAGANTPLGLVRIYWHHGLDGVVEDLWRKAKPHEEFAYGWVAGQLVVCMRSPEMVHAAFSENSLCTSRLFPNHEGPFGGIYRIFGDNIFTMHSDDMRHARHLVLHRFFIRRNIINHFDKICNTADKHIDALLNSPERATLDVGKCMVAFTMDTWCRAQLGMPGLDPAAAMRLSTAISDGEALATSAPHLIWRGVLSRVGVRDLATADAAEIGLRNTLFAAMHNELIDPHRATLESTDNLMRSLAENEAEAGRDGSFVSEAVMSQMAVLLLTGHETAASLLTWTLCELARNPRAQTLLRAEVQRVFWRPAPHRGRLGAHALPRQRSQRGVTFAPTGPLFGTHRHPTVHHAHAAWARDLSPRDSACHVHHRAASYPCTLGATMPKPFGPSASMPSRARELKVQFMPFSCGG